MPIYFPPSSQGFEPRHLVFSTWHGHLPFAYDLIAAFAPTSLVELGVYRGVSYFTFCQAVQEFGLGTRCYGVDHFAGDKHTDFYGDEIWDEVRGHNEEHYQDFSTLLRMSFNEAVERFEEESVDLIHLDGLHTYEAVTEDFDNWYPKLLPGGLFLFHDIRARLHDFGVWQFWEEKEREHETFAFNHSYGLGVIRKPGGDRSGDPPLLRMMFDRERGEQPWLRSFYVLQARSAELERKWARMERVKQQRQTG